MLEMTLILILVVVAMVAIIVNRKSLLACISITVVAAALGLGFLLLYANADKFGSHEKLLRFTITSSAVTIVALLAVTYIGVKMHFNNQNKSGKYVPGIAPEAAGEPRLIPGTNVLAKAVGIFGRQPIERADKPPVIETAVKRVVATEAAMPAKAAAPATEPIAPVDKQAAVKVAAQVQPIDAQLKRMLEKGEAFKAAGQYVLAEQMYVTYITRCTDNSSSADGELLMLDCRIAAGNAEGAKEQLDDLLNKLHSGIYLLTQEQKRKLAECKMNLFRLQQGK